MAAFHPPFVDLDSYLSHMTPDSLAQGFNALCSVSHKGSQISRPSFPLVPHPPRHEPSPHIGAFQRPQAHTVSFPQPPSHIIHPIPLHPIHADHERPSPREHAVKTHDPHHGGTPMHHPVRDEPTFSFTSPTPIEHSKEPCVHNSLQRQMSLPQIPCDSAPETITDGPSLLFSSSPARISRRPVVRHSSLPSFDSIAHLLAQARLRVIDDSPQPHPPTTPTAHHPPHHLPNSSLRYQSHPHARPEPSPRRSSTPPHHPSPPLSRAPHDPRLSLSIAPRMPSPVPAPRLCLFPSAMVDKLLPSSDIPFPFGAETFFRHVSNLSLLERQTIRAENAKSAKTKDIDDDDDDGPATIHIPTANRSVRSPAPRSKAPRAKKKSKPARAPSRESLSARVVAATTAPSPAPTAHAPSHRRPPPHSHPHPHPHPSSTSDAPASPLHPALLASVLSSRTPSPAVPRPRRDTASSLSTLSAGSASASGPASAASSAASSPAVGSSRLRAPSAPRGKSSLVLPALV